MNELQERGLALLRDDLTLFASECLVVAPKAPGPNIPLNFNSAQMFVHQRLEDQIAHAGWVRALVLKGRQQGISTYVAARYYHKTSMNKGHRALIIAHEQQASDNLFEMVRRYHKANPLRPSIQASNAKELKFGALGSGYRVSTAGTKDTGRGGTFQLAHASEYGFWPNADGHSAGLAQTVADLPGTEIIKESTANGVGNAFHIEWQQAESGEGDYIPIFVPWFWQDEYRRRVPIDLELDADEERIMNAYGLSLEQMAWRQAKIKSLGADRSWIFVQEYPMCVAAGERVNTDRGLIRIEDVEAGDVTPFGTVSKAWRTGSKPVVSVRTALGYELRCTDEHRVLTDGGDWEEASKTVGKRIALAPHPLSDGEDFEVRYEIAPCCNARIRITEDMARFIGLFAGDGSHYENTVSIVCDGADVDVIEEVGRLCVSLFGVQPASRVVGSKGGGVEVRFSRVRLTEVLDAIGLLRRTSSGGMKRKVSVPECIWRSPARVVREFLRGLFEADGFASRCGNTVKMFSKHKEFVRDVQRLLLAFGITCRVIRIDKVTNGYNYVGYELSLRKDESALYKERIGFISSRKQSRLDLAAPRVTKKGVSVTYFDEVVSVVDDGESDVYDMTVPGESRFDAGGIVVHNCASEAFISRTEDPFIPVVLVMEAINNTYREVYGPLIVGVDPAEHGEDRTAIVFRRGRLVTRIETYKDKETMETAGIVANIINEHKPDAVMIDSIGIGAGIYSRLRELGHDNVISVRSGRRARDDKQYVNKRAEMWADLKKWLEERPCRMPNNQALASDLSAPQYGYDSSGRLQIEPKPKMKARGVRSPDIADALCLTFAEPVSTARHDKLIVTAQPAYAGPASHAGY